MIRPEDQSSLPTAMVRPTPPAVLDAQQAVQLDALRQATLGEYEILGELGRGGMATVYLAHEIALDRKVAIKVMSPALLSGEGMVARFKREARTAAALSHPHVIPIFAVRESAAIVYFVMKFIEGRPLDSIIREVGPLPIPMVRAILHQVGGALGYAHGKGVVHRDMKPANIMVDTDGWAVVTDFGIAKVSEAHGLTMTGATIGTPFYMSPEQCAAKKELTGASDQYSLGIVAYEMLTGRVPFTADTTLGIMYAHFHEQPPSVAKDRPDCPPEMAAALLQMLAKAPEQRFADVETAVAALGGAPLTRDDPTLARLKTLARAGAGATLAKTISTPASPPPASVPHPTTKTVRGKAGTVPPTRVAPRARRLGLLLWGIPVVAAAAAGGWWLAARASRQTAATPTAAESTVAVNAAPAPGSSRQTLGGPVALRREAPTAPAPPSSSPTSLETQNLEPQFRALQVQALARRLRAAGAGATTEEMAPGDAEAQRAEELGRQRSFAEGKTHLEAAINQWTEAARVARERGGPRATRRAARAGDVREEIQGAISAYAAALESRDLSRVRRAYPGITVPQVQEWGALFLKARNLRVRLTVSSVEPNGARTDAGVDGSYEYDDVEAGRGERQVVSLRATLERGFGGWRILSIR
jgi:serine/threonine protein kinase